jgi:hypothetical protein
MAQMHDIERESAREHTLPIEEILGKQSLEVLRSVDKATAAILKRPTGVGTRRLSDFERLTPWRTLKKSQLCFLCDILNDPDSYWNGWPKYRRPPPRPCFAVKLRSSKCNADLLIDLHNPGWELFCGDEDYWGFNFAGPRLVALAKSVFAEYASGNSKSIWKKGVVEKLAKSASTHN